MTPARTGRDRPIKGPAPRPCASCPYRQDAPSGVWEASEYETLTGYDAPTYAQPERLFLCHQNDADSDAARLCGGWVGCHGTELLALRLATADGTLAAEDVDSTLTYSSPIALFGSGREAADHGVADIDQPGASAQAAISKIVRRRRLT
ncbi:DUF6283 family protein [Gordonia phosphorivorans]|uniref:DUF6283 family protein n=1 Tax=Gordonia phosphorivorans TaxID=1056982 RepID=A0ABV6H5Z1_9ACTN